jgi:hypothetical protein
MFANADLEQQGVSSDDETRQVFPVAKTSESGAASLRRVVGAGLGVIAFVACGAVVLLSAAPVNHGKTNVGFNARSLFDHADIHQVAADNIMKIHKDWFGQSPSVWHIRRLTEESFRNASRSLSPETAAVLEKTAVSPEQKDATVKAMRYLSDRRVQKLGYDVAKAVKTAAKQHPDRLNDPEKLKKHIAQTLGAKRLEEIRKLSDEMFPTAVAKELGQGHGFEHLLDPKRVQFMSKIDDRWEDQFKMASEEPTDVDAQRRLAGYTGGWGAPGAPSAGAPSAGAAYGAAPVSAFAHTTTDHNMGTAEAVLGILGAAAEEANALVRIIRPLSKEFKNDLNVSPMATSAIGGASYLVEVASCELNAFIDNENPVEMVGCPMEFGSEGFDACREALAMTGILGDNNPKNGKQGNHNAEQSKDTMGIFDGKNSILH